MTRRLPALALATFALLGLGACGSDDSPVPGAATDPGGDTAGVTVVARDISFASDSFQADAGPVHITYRNEGSIPHTLVIEGVDGFKLDVAGKGDVDEGSVTVAPGTYTFYCDVAGHRQAGMEGTFTVR